VTRCPVCITGVVPVGEAHCERCGNGPQVADPPLELLYRSLLVPCAWCHTPAELRQKYCSTRCRHAAYERTRHRSRARRTAA